MAGILSTGFGIVKAGANLFGGKKESKADKTKQQIQKELKEAGYGQFSQMQGWGGDEKRKRDAMRTIQRAINANPANARRIESFLEDGQITPNTIQKTKQLTGATGSTAPATRPNTEGARPRAGRRTSMATAPSARSSAGGIGSMLAANAKWIVGGLVALMLGYLVTQNQN